MTDTTREPRTAAGRAWLAEAAGYMEPRLLTILRERILAIEADVERAYFDGYMAESGDSPVPPPPEQEGQEVRRPTTPASRSSHDALLPGRPRDDLPRQ